MKKNNYVLRITVILAFLCSFLTQSVAAEFGCSAYYDGYWSSWHTIYAECYGKYSSFILYSSDVHPSNYFFKFTINNYQQPTSKEIKAHRKSNTWYEYQGTVEYYVHEDYPTIKDVLKKEGFPFIYYIDKPYWHNWGYDAKKPIVRRTAIATIKIAPYKKHPETYNFLFDNVGFAIDMRGNSFKTK